MKLRELGDLPVANQWMVDTREHDLDLYTRAGQPPLHCVGQSTIGIALKPQRGPNQVGFNKYTLANLEFTGPSVRGQQLHGPYKLCLPDL